MNTRHRGHTIVTETSVRPEGDWTVTLGIVAPDGRPVVAGLNFGTELVFATSALAARAGVLLAKYWIDQRQAPNAEAS